MSQSTTPSPLQSCELNVDQQCVHVCNPHVCKHSQLNLGILLMRWWMPSWRISRTWTRASLSFWTNCGLMFQQRIQQYRMCQTWLDSDLGNRWASMLLSPRNCWHTVGTWGQLLKCTSGNPGPTVWLAHGGPKASSISPGQVKLDFHLVSSPWNLRPMLRSRDQSHLNI